jgi:hypothetical protein
MARSANRYLQRAQRHSWEDGVAEIFIGIGAMLYAAFQAMSEHVPVPGSVTLQIILTVVASTLVMFTGLVIFWRIAERVKARTTYQRTGFVELKRPPVEWSTRAIVLTPLIAVIAGITGVALVLGLLILFALVKVNGSLLILSAILASSAASIGQRTQLPRFYGLAGAILLVGIGLTATNTFGLTGLSGGIALVRFLRTHPTSETQS